VFLSRATAPVHPAALWAIIGTSLIHIVRSRLDQTNPVAGVAIMLAADCLHLSVCIAYLVRAIGARFVPLRAVYDALMGSGLQAPSAVAELAEEGGAAASSVAAPAAAPLVRRATPVSQALDDGTGAGGLSRVAALLLPSATEYSARDCSVDGAATAAVVSAVLLFFSLA